MKVNIFKIDNDDVIDLLEALEDNGFECVTDSQDGNKYLALYLRKKTSKKEGWLRYFRHMIDDESYSKYTENVGGEILSGLFIIQEKSYAYAFSYGQAHFIVRKYCDKDFGLNLAERIIDPQGIKMKHSQTFTSAGKKDITSYLQNREFNDSRDYGEAFSYIKCKTINKDIWGETADFGESARFSFANINLLNAENIYHLTDEIERVLKSPANINLPRYRKVSDQTILNELNGELSRKFIEFITDIDISDYWLTGVGFNFSNDYHYALKIYRTALSEIRDSLDASIIRKIILENKEQIKSNYDDIKVLFYDDNSEIKYSKKLKELLQITIEHEGKYYVLFQNDWVEFSESYVKFIEEQVDSINLKIKKTTERNETKLIDSLVASGEYIQLHKQNVHIGKYCIEKADLMNDEYVIMVKSQHQQSDLVYLIKQATTSLRLTNAGEIGENVFKVRNVCLWMMINRKKLNKLSDFKSFHLLDALNDFKKAVTNMNLIPEIWITLKQ